MTSHNIRNYKTSIMEYAKEVSRSYSKNTILILNLIIIITVNYDEIN